MAKFEEFLQQTTGYHLLKFWLDAEYYKDQVVGWEEAPEQRREFGIRLFRYIFNKNAGGLKKSCFLNITAMILRTVLYYPRHVKLGSVIYPALIDHSFPSK